MMHDMYRTFKHFPEVLHTSNFQILNNESYRGTELIRDFARLRDPCLKIRDRIINVPQDFETVHRAANPRFRDSCLEYRDFETGLLFSEMHHFLTDLSIPLVI